MVSGILDSSSIMTESPLDLNHRIAQRARQLRAARGLSLDELARLTGVSRSMLSLIERGESSPTAVVLEKLATGLGITMAALFDVPGAPNPDGPIARIADQPEWVDPASGYRRRNVSPPGTGHPMQIVEVHFPAGARVAFESGDRDRPVRQQVWLLEGQIEVTTGGQTHALLPGDCLAMQLDAFTMFSNPGATPARYAVVITTT
jgi:transcriptional regulator with XRE-family HTH domain